MSLTDADAILAMGRNFWNCRVLLTAAELDLFTLLSHDALTAAEVAGRIGGDKRATTVLLDAVAALQLLEKRQGRYTCPADVARHLSADAPDSILAMLMHMNGLWPSWSELTGVVRGDENAVRRALAERTDTYAQAFIGAMHVVTRAPARDIVTAIKPGAARRLLDIGGASGTITLAFLNASDKLKATLFDLPHVIELARERIGDAGMLARVELVAGDFHTDELPPGHDLALLSQIAHQNSPLENVELFKKAWRALVPGGRLVIRDHVMSEDRTQPARGAIFAVNMLVRTAGGGTYTSGEFEQMLAQAGFESVRLIHPGGDGMDEFIEAYRPM
ncbi:MAG: methyltransferase domain-containing protein [Phycisphaerae bacterium]|nr:methyltransferase domain-containing protein [Phycisphaerae bacterium]